MGGDSSSPALRIRTGPGGPGLKLANVAVAAVAANVVSDVGVGALLGPGAMAGIKMFLIGGVIFLGVAAVGYGGYRLYQYYRNRLSITQRVLENLSEEEVTELVK
jgi:hypothetical protein